MAIFYLGKGHVGILGHSHRRGVGARQVGFNLIFGYGSAFDYIKGVGKGDIASEFLYQPFERYPIALVEGTHLRRHVAHEKGEFVGLARVKAVG